MNLAYYGMLKVPVITRISVIEAYGKSFSYFLQILEDQDYRVSFKTKTIIWYAHMNQVSWVPNILAVSSLVVQRVTVN